VAFYSRGWTAVSQCERVSFLLSVAARWVADVPNLREETSLRGIVLQSEG